MATFSHSIKLAILCSVVLLVSRQGAHGLFVPWRGAIPLPLSQLRPLTYRDQSQPPTSFSRVLVVAAHPDDIESAAGGTVAAMTQNGVEVRYLLLTNGDKGTSNRSMTPDQLAAIRQKEQLIAASVLGVKSVDFLNVSDGEVMNTLETQKKMTKVIRKYRPDIILTWNPVLANYMDLYSHGLQHSDHRTSGQVVLDVVYPKIRDPLYWPELLEEGLEPWKVNEVYLFNWSIDMDDPFSTMQVDISATLDLKIKALLQHKSQISNPDELSNGIKNQALTMGKASVPEVAAAEWFKRVIMLP